MNIGKLKDVAGLIKAKVTKDELEEALINATSEENWQASTHILHQIANAAYNYEKWQQINQFIWQKLKKSKSWRKILKSLNLVQFLLKNGPPSIISSFKYDIYQFRSFDSYTAYDNGIDRGESIRQKAKTVVDLLSNEELLEQQRVKAKTIRERMSGVVSGSNYGGFGSNDVGRGFGGGAKYGSIDNKSYSQGGYGGSSGYGDGLGTYGDYNYNKSTLDKYKGGQTQPSTTTTQQNKKPTSNTNINTVEEKNQPTETKKPFERIAPKLVKPGQKPKQPTQTQTQASQNKQKSGGNIDIMDDILGGDEDLQVPKQNGQGQQVIQGQQNGQQQNGHQHQQTNVQQKTNNDIGFDWMGGQTTTQPQVQTHQPIQSQQTNQPQTNYQQGQNYQQGINFLNNPQQGQYSQPQYAQYSQPQYSQQPQYNQAQFTQPQYNQQQYTQPQYTQPQYNQANYGQFTQSSQPQPHSGIQQQQSQWTVNQTQQQNGGISLNLNQPAQSNKEEDEFGNFSSGQNTNVKWLSTQEKGLIDFSDFGEQMKKDTQKNNSGSGNQIDTTWTW